MSSEQGALHRTSHRQSEAVIACIDGKAWHSVGTAENCIFYNPGARNLRNLQSRFSSY